MFKSGKFISEHVTQLDGSRVSEKQVQPHGVELTVDKVFRLQNYCVLGDDDYAKSERSEAHFTDSGKYKIKNGGQDHTQAPIVDVESEDSDEFRPSSRHEFFELDEPHYVLPRGPYVVRYNEKIEIPDKHVGLVFPRSRLIRNNNHLSTAVWDSGYEGRGEGGLHINTLTFLQKGMRVGQIMMARASVMEQYDGSHQEENLE